MKQRIITFFTFVLVLSTLIISIEQLCTTLRRQQRPLLCQAELLGTINYNHPCEYHGVSTNCHIYTPSETENNEQHIIIGYPECSNKTEMCYQKFLENQYDIATMPTGDIVSKIITCYHVIDSVCAVNQLYTFNYTMKHNGETFVRIGTIDNSDPHDGTECWYDPEVNSLKVNRAHITILEKIGAYILSWVR